MSHQQISYTDVKTPADGEAIEIAAGLLWARLPIPFPPFHINVYLIEDYHGWWIVDTGIGGEETEGLWRKIFQKYLRGKPVVGVIVTHLHPDHMGQAGYLTDRWQCSLWMTQLEFFYSQVFGDRANLGDSWQIRQFYKRNGLDQQQAAAAMENLGGYKNSVTPVPRSYHRLVHGQALAINDCEWRIIVGKGHSPEHACLYCSSLNILISGDQILPEINPPLMISAMEPDENPVSDYLTSLERFQHLPNDTLVLPSHGDIFHGLGFRIDDLYAHRQKKLTRVYSACHTPGSLRDLIPRIHKAELTGVSYGMAMTDCLANINYLLNKGLLTRELNPQGIYIYKTVVSNNEERITALPSIGMLGE